MSCKFRRFPSRRVWRSRPPPQTSSLAEMETVGRAALLITGGQVRSDPRFDGSSLHVIFTARNATGQDKTKIEKFMLILPSTKLKPRTVTFFLPRRGTVSCWKRAYQSSPGIFFQAHARSILARFKLASQYCSTIRYKFIHNDFMIVSE